MVKPISQHLADGHLALSRAGGPIALALEKRKIQPEVLLECLRQSIVATEELRLALEKLNAATKE